MIIVDCHTNIQMLAQKRQGEDNFEFVNVEF